MIKTDNVTNNSNHKIKIDHSNKMKNNKSNKIITKKI